MAVKRNSRATSAGGVVYRHTPDGPEIALAHRRAPLLWALPKGTPASGETLAETALRETSEETGLEVEIEVPIGPISYVFVRGSTRYFKTVHFYLMRAVGGDPALHDHEFDEVRWVVIPEALRLLSYPTERSVVEHAEGLLAGPTDGASDGAAVPSATPATAARATPERVR